MSIMLEVFRSRKYRIIGSKEPVTILATSDWMNPAKPVTALAKDGTVLRFDRSGQSGTWPSEFDLEEVEN